MQAKALLILLLLPSAFALIVTTQVNAAPIPYKLTTTVNPTGAGIVALTPPGGSYLCCTPLVTVSAKATASSGYSFVAWVLNDTTAYVNWADHLGWYSNINPVPIPMNHSYALTAYFQQQNQWTRYSGNPVVTHGTGSTDWDKYDVWIGRPFLFQNGTFGMVYSGDGDSGIAIGLASSTNGLAWNKFPLNPILTAGGGNGAWDAGRLRLGNAFYDASAGEYKLYYSSESGTTGAKLTGIGLLTSPDAKTWTHANSGDPIISRVIDCTSSCPRIRNPYVLKVGSTYMMWHNGRSGGTAGGGGGFFLETSSDGIAWTEQNGDQPVLTPIDWNYPEGVPSYAWDGDYVYAVSVFYDPAGGNFKMFYTGYDWNEVIGRIGFAISADGINWVRYPANPILSPNAGTTWDNGDLVGEPGAILVNGTIYMYYSGDTFSTGNCIDYSPNTGEPVWPECNHYQTESIGLLYAQEVPLLAGWNLFSLPVVPNDSTLKTILAPQIAANDFTVVWGYAAATKVWSFFKPPATGTLATLKDGNGYWIYMTKPDTLIVGGNVIPPASLPPSYPLSPGWNLVGFKPQPTIQSDTVGHFLSSITGSYDTSIVYLYDNLNGVWIRASPSTTIQPGQAIWVYVTGTATVTLRP